MTLSNFSTKQIDDILKMLSRNEISEPTATQRLKNVLDFELHEAYECGMAEAELKIIESKQHTARVLDMVKPSLELKGVGGSHAVVDQTPIEMDRKQFLFEVAQEDRRNQQADNN